MAENTEHKEMGRRIESRRKGLGLTLNDVALEVGVAASTIQRYEKGHFEKIKMPVIEAIAAALHVNPEWVIGETADPIDYEDKDLIAEIPLSYFKACDGDIKRAYAMWTAVDEDASRYYGSTTDFAKNSREEEKPPTPEAEGGRHDSVTAQIMDIVGQMSPEEKQLYLENLKTLRRLQEQGRKPDSQE